MKKKSISLNFRKKQANKLALFSFILSLFILGTGMILGDIPILWVTLGIIFFTLGAYIVGGYNDPNDPNPQD